MSDRQQLNEMKKFMKISEGSWALPRTKEDFDNLATILQSGVENIKIHDQIYNVLGDDTLFDRLDKLDPHKFDAPEEIIQWMKDQRKDKYSTFPNIWNTFKLSQQDNSPMSEDPDDTDWDAHWAREDGDDERADDLEADAEFARMDDELSEDENDARGKMCPVCTGGRRSGYDNDCPNCGGEGYVTEDNDPDGMGSYDIIWNEDTWKEAIPYDVAEKEVHRILQIINDSALQAHDNNDHLKVKKTADGDAMIFTVLDPIDDDYQVIRVEPSHMLEDAEDPGREKDGTIFDFIKKGDHVYIMVERHTIAFHPDVKTSPLPKEKAWVEVTEVNHDERWLQVSDHSYSTTYKVYPDKEYVEFYDFEKEVAARKKAKLGEVGEVKHDDYGAAPVYENYPDDECDRCLGLGNHPGRAGEDCPECHGTGKCPKSNGDIDLGSVVENVLQEYPGQPKDFYDPDEDDLEYDPYDEADQREMADDMADEFEKDFIDPEYEDSELGYRFD